MDFLIADVYTTEDKVAAGQYKVNVYHITTKDSE